MKRFLITTALEETWRHDEPTLFLGEWCRLHEREAHCSVADFEVLSYHWDDRQKLRDDYLYLGGLYERLLADLSGHLNRIHGVNHSPRYWRILVGPWLGYFVQMLFDRWSSISRALGQFDLSGTVVLVGREESLVPNDMADFMGLYLGDQWNHHIYALILREWTDIPCVEKARLDDVDLREPPAFVSKKQKIKRRLGAWMARAAMLFSKDSDAFLMSTYLPIAKEMLFGFKLGQFPQIWRAPPPVRTEVDWGKRNWILAGDERDSEFERIARAMISRQIPTAYLEGYESIVDQAESLPWPRRPKVIWTSMGVINNDPFKAWAADKVEKGVPLVLSQHGGHYGIGRMFFSEEHEVAISDRFLTWGWRDDGNPKIRTVGQLKAKLPLGVDHASQPDALLVCTVTCRYSYMLHSVPVARQWIDYFNDQFSFVEHLPEHIRRSLVVRLYMQDLGWNQKGRWQERFPEVRVNDGRTDINSLLRRSRLYISTYNATTFLESFTMDVPTVIFWNPAHWELRDSAIPYFEALLRVGIFHDTPESAARHVAAIWGDVDAWWRSPSVREAVEQFKVRYCDVPENLLGQIKIVLSDSQDNAEGLPK